MSKLGGIIRGKETLHITHIPERKKPVLMIGNKYCVHKIATFDSEEDAEEFLEMLFKWLNCKPKEGDAE